MEEKKIKQRREKEKKGQKQNPNSEIQTFESKLSKIMIVYACVYREREREREYVSNHSEGLQNFILINKGVTYLY